MRYRSRSQIKAQPGALGPSPHTITVASPEMLSMNPNDQLAFSMKRQAFPACAQVSNKSSGSSADTVASRSSKIMNAAASSPVILQYTSCTSSSIESSYARSRDGCENVRTRDRPSASSKLESRRCVYDICQRVADVGRWRDQEVP
ncbi:hypothetical protein MRB53_038402 [Persea americana]|nr:hypothetical protein MRB53_038402 [Persea americana]